MKRSGTASDPARSQPTKSSGQRSPQHEQLSSRATGIGTRPPAIDFDLLLKTEFSPPFIGLSGNLFDMPNSLLLFYDVRHVRKRPTPAALEINPLDSRKHAFFIVKGKSNFSVLITPDVDHSPGKYRTATLTFISMEGYAPIDS